MPMDSVTEENVTRLYKERDDKQSTLDKIVITPIQVMWLQDLEVLEKSYLEYKIERTNLNSGKKIMKSVKSKEKKKNSHSNKINLIIEED
jgi:hypothetical protein